MIKMFPKTQNCFYLAFLQMMMYSDCYYPIGTYWLLKDLTSTLESFEIFTFFNTYVNKHYHLQQKFTQDLMIIGCLCLSFIMSILF